MKPTVAKAGLTVCLLLILLTVFLFFHTGGTDAGKMKVAYGAFILLMLHGCYRAVWHLRHPSAAGEVEEMEAQLRQFPSTKELLQLFFDPRQMRFRTVGSLFILLVLYLFARPVWFWAFLALTVCIKSFLFFQMYRYQKAHAHLVNTIAEKALNRLEEGWEISENAKTAPQAVAAVLLQLTELARKTVGFYLAKPDDDPLPVGASKFGGQPDVPPDFEWPQGDTGQPLQLLLQINCAHLAAYDADKLLPASGRLYFFCDVSAIDSGNAHPAVCVLYTDRPAAQLHRQAPPALLRADLRLNERLLLFNMIETIPSYDDMLRLGLANPEHPSFDEYYDAVEVGNLQNPTDAAGTLLGYADTIQSSMLSDRPADDILLLQMYSIEDVDDGLQFGDSGMLYCYITRHDLQQRDFSHVRFEMQSF